MTIAEVVLVSARKKDVEVQHVSAFIIKYRRGSIDCMVVLLTRCGVTVEEKLYAA